MKFTREQVAEIIGPATYPMTTAQIESAARTAHGAPAAWDESTNIRTVLGAMVTDGELVTAKVSEADNGAYGFVARWHQAHMNERWYMNKVRADEFKIELVERKRRLSGARECARELVRFLTASGLSADAAMYVDVRRHDVTGRIKVSIEGTDEMLVKLIDLIGNVDR